MAERTVTREELERLQQQVVLSVPEAARLLGVSKHNAYAAAAAGTIPAIRLGHRYVVPAAKVWTMLGLD